MEHAETIPDYRVRRLTDDSIAKLLGITIQEYHSLSHRPIEAYTDANGDVIEFYIHISTNNDPGLLNKLNPDRSNFIRFKPEEVYSMYA